MTYRSPSTFSELFLRLPRELRDLIYPPLVACSQPQSLNDQHVPSITSHYITGPIISAEAREAYFVYNTFIVHFEPAKQPVPADCWGPWDQVLKPLIRHLIVHADEPIQLHVTSEQYETNHFYSTDRQMWQSLLSLPSLQTVEVRLQKWYDDSLSWYAFAPVLHQLRHQKTNLDLKFTVSFDTVLKKSWENPYWSRFPRNANAAKYEAMGPIDVTEMVAKPTEQDEAHVKEYLADKVMPKGRSVGQGLLDLNVASRRELGYLYVVKEPELLRVLMWEHWEIYKRMEEKRRAIDENLFQENNHDFPRGRIGLSTDPSLR